MPRPCLLVTATLVFATAIGCVHAPEVGAPPPGGTSRSPSPGAPPTPSQANAAVSSSAQSPSPSLPVAGAEEDASKAEARGPLTPSMAYPMAAAAFAKAKNTPDGPKRTAAFLEAAKLYERALGVDPAADNAPEAAVLGAFAYKQAGEYTSAVELYRLFLARYAAEDRLSVLERTDPRALKERLHSMRAVTETLGAAYILMFDHEAAAVHFDGVARQRRFEEAYRRDAAHNAAILHANLGAPEKAAAAREIFVRLGPDVRSKANVDMILAEAGFHRWEPSATDTDAVRAERKARQKALEKVVATYERTDAAATIVLEAAYRLTQIRRDDKDGSAASWCKKVERAYEIHFRTAGNRDLPEERLAAGSWAFGSRESDRAAECVFRRADAALRAAHPPDGLPSAAPATDLAGFRAAQKTVQDKDLPALKPLVDAPGRFGSATWAVEARAREGALEDALRKMLESVRPAKGSAAWKERETALRAAEERSARRDLEAVTWASGYGVSSPSVGDASRRLARFLDERGPASLAALRSMADKPPFEIRSRTPPRPFSGIPLGKTLSPPPSALAPPAPLPARRPP